ncbi:MAG: YIP1 family protein [Methanomicrobiales archaeon]|nr:YIP1 family protein [Methanomicrobiales archaeon]
MKENLLLPILIVGAGSAITLVTMGVRMLLGYYPQAAFSTLISWSSWYFFYPFLEWGFFSGVIYIISLSFSGMGSFRATLQNIGYGLFPWTLSTVIELVITVLFFKKPQLIYYDLLQTPQFVNGIIFLLFMIWTCYLWVFAIKSTHQISQRKAVGSVLLLVIIYFLTMYALTFARILLFPAS